MACDPASLIEQAKCINACIPPGLMPAVNTALLCTIASGTHGPTSETFTVPGDATWKAPTGVTSVDAECWAGGGSSSASLGVGAGGGGGGAYAKKTIAVIPGNFYNYHVGAGGIFDTADGEDTWFVSTLTVSAQGGSNGTGGGTGGLGGTVGGSVGTIKFAGGAGGGGDATAGGGGGSSAGSASNGNIGGNAAAGVGGTGGAAVVGGGAGGNGANAGANPVAGSVPSGASGGDSLIGTGFNGASGKIKLSYILP